MDKKLYEYLVQGNKPIVWNGKLVVIHSVHMLGNGITDIIVITEHGEVLKVRGSDILEIPQ